MVKLGAELVERVGFVAAFCTTVAFVPQLVRVLKLRSARDISLGTFLLYSLGVVLWLVYGICLGSKPMIASNVVTLLLSMGILWAKLRYSHSGMKREVEV
ncbi:MAG TPA: SemiSWEET transporter [Edaphobacter sp.]|jgi:MtN3 and saliva related transmembrane protein|nr:SemiSWEET transporter [Edaphobacter sp.]